MQVLSGLMLLMGHYPYDVGVYGRHCLRWVAIVIRPESSGTTYRQVRRTSPLLGHFGLPGAHSRGSGNLTVVVPYTFAAHYHCVVRRVHQINVRMVGMSLASWHFAGIHVAFGGFVVLRVMAFGSVHCTGDHHTARAVNLPSVLDYVSVLHRLVAVQVKVMVRLAFG